MDIRIRERCGECRGAGFMADASECDVCRTTGYTEEYLPLCEFLMVLAETTKGAFTPATKEGL